LYLYKINQYWLKQKYKDKPVPIQGLDRPWGLMESENP